MSYNPTRALELLRKGTGRPDARFHDGQEEAIRRLVDGTSRQLVIQKTGWGKSSVYFIAARMLREAGQGPTILISPLLALMRNQVEAAARMGVRAITIHSENKDAWPEMEAAVLARNFDVLLISPERLANLHFRQHVLGPISGRVAMLVVDEAHCISDWGHDFRPQYRLIQRAIANFPPNLRVLATTATANNRVLEDVSSMLGKEVTVTRGPLQRESLTLQSIALPGQAARLAWLAEQLGELKGHGIIYTLTKRDARVVSGWLRSRGFEVASYTGATGESRPALEQALLSNKVKALVATSALGMGFDKPDLGFVIHYQMPGSVVAYYQQVGRAGRAIEAAYGVLLAGDEDTTINEWFIANAFPSRAEVRLVLDALQKAAYGASVPELESRINMRRSRLTKALELLSFESPAPVVKDESKWRLTAAPVPDAFWERVDRLTAQRNKELARMQEYARLPFGEHMGFLLGQLDATDATVAPPGLPPLPSTFDPQLVREAIDYLRRSDLPIKPRAQWPGSGLLKSQVRGKIAPQHRAEEGRALCMWGDAGWGEEVRTGKYTHRRFSDELVAAAAGMVRRWKPAQAPAWVTCVPSHRHPELVRDAAQRLAGLLGLPFHPVIAIGEPRPEQKTMTNSAQQARNVDGAFVIAGGRVPSGAVLLVDDVVDSRWTTTMCAWQLRNAGSGPVLPVAFAAAGDDSGDDEDA